MKLESIKNSVTRTYLLIFSVVIIIPIGLIYAMTMGYTEAVMEKEITEKKMVNLDALIKRLEADMTSVIFQLEMIAKQEDDSKIDVGSMFTRAKQTIVRTPLIQSVAYIDREKKLVFEAPFDPDLPVTTYDYPDFEKVKWSLNYHVSDMIFNFRDYRAVTVAVPVTTQQYTFQGLVIAEISQQYLSDLLEAVTLPHGGFSYIFDRKGKVLASTNPADIGKDYSAQPIFSLLSLDRFGLIRDTFQGEESIIAYQPTRMGWGMILGIPEEVAFVPLYRLAMILRIGFLGILLLSLFFIGMGMRQILYPITKLTQISRHYDDKQALLSIKRLKRFQSNDEIGHLMKTILHMGLTNLEKQRLLAANERFLHDVIEGMPYAILTVNMTNHITYVNQKLVELTGLPADALVGKHLPQLPLMDGGEEFWRAMDGEGAADAKEASIRDIHGQRHIVKIAASPFFNEESVVIGTIMAIQDISHLKLLEERVKQNEKLALIGQISTGIAHEIKNPLAILSGASELLVEELDEPKARRDPQAIRELADDIHRVVRRMNGTVNDFLSFAKKKNPVEEPVETDSILREVIHLLRFKLNEAKVQVTMNVLTRQTTLIGNKDTLIQAFLNLILNSIEAMPSGGLLAITVKEEMKTGEEKWLAVAFKDSGIGIPEQNLDWIFNPFFTTKEEGSGYGLTIARDIIAEYGGTIEIESRVGEGTSICCKFPR
ncbi:ATP-binding protein [Brevibacillus sp. B_LB10_24]|uniref:sensor histidine kinase n=1 Tax=Brevibacillus sp. B_LB10_24 TaxID=3380645 RepID=UPI0038BB3ECC